MRFIRCGLGGTLLGFLTLAGFSFVGVPVIPTDAHGLPLATPSAPTLAPALLTASDLPPGFVPVPPTPAPPGADGCAALLANPAAGWAGAVRVQFERGGTTVWEAVATPAGDAVGRLRYELLSCPGVGERGDALAIPGGWLAATRTGTAVVVLRSTGGSVPDPGVTLRTAVGKLPRVPVK